MKFDCAGSGNHDNVDVLMMFGLPRPPRAVPLSPGRKDRLVPRHLGGSPGRRPLRKGTAMLATPPCVGVDSAFGCARPR